MLTLHAYIIYIYIYIGIKAINRIKISFYLRFPEKLLYENFQFTEINAIYVINSQRDVK